MKLVSLRLAHPTSLLLLAAGAALSAFGQAASTPPPTPKLKEEMRAPWTRGSERFIRRWQVLGEIPLAPNDPDAFTRDPFATHGGEAALKPSDKTPATTDAGASLSWRAVTAWGDAVDLSDGKGLKRHLAGYAAATLTRPEAGKALLSLGSDESLRAWVNGTLVLERRGPRPLTFDEDLVEVDLKAGDNLLLVKVEQHSGPWNCAARILEPGTLPSRVQEISPSFILENTATLVVKTDVDARHATEPPVTVSVVAAGGRVLAGQSAARGESLRFDVSAWPDGPYELRCVTTQLDGLRTATHLPWFKGDALAAARTLVAAAAQADAATPAGQTVRMLAELTLDRLGTDGLAATGNPWWAIHSPLMEYAELQLEAAGQRDARARAYGFYRLAWRDDVDGSTQYARAYLPGGYDPAKKTPLVLKLHGYNPPNPDYIRWWAVDSRHNLSDADYGRGEGVILIEPHGRGNTQYLGLGDQDVVRVIQLAKERFNIDPDRVYLTGESMGGWGTWNVATRHPGLFAAIAPIFGGVDYHSYLTEEQLAALTPLPRFLHEKDSSWALADSLLTTPILVLHGDADQAVNVDWSRYGVRLLQRWGYDVRYVELPGYAHEDLNRFPFVISWFLEHRRDPSPRHVRIRSAELQNASAWWAAVEQAERPDRFMLVDAAVVAPNTLRIDSQNVLALTLSPGAALVDPAKPVTLVWNGEKQSATLRDGRLSLRAAGYTPPPGAKNTRIAGPIGDICNTPFAIVTGTTSADPAMNEVIRQKSQALAALWQDWQRQPPRVFKDTELSDADAARYSLVLIGGPDANLVTRKLADKLPLMIARDAVTIGGRTFAATDARVLAIHPNPLNPQRYVLVVAGTSPTGLQFWSPPTIRGAQFDFTIEDNHVAAVGQQVERSALWVAGGWLDRNWSRDDALITLGQPAVRDVSVVLRGPLPPEVIDAYLGNYQIAPGAIVHLTRRDRQLVAAIEGQPTAELIPAGEDQFYITEGSVLVKFRRDAARRPVGFTFTQRGHEISGQRVD